MTSEHVGRGSIAELPVILRDLEPAPVLLVHGRSAFNRPTSAARIVESLLPGWPRRRVCPPPGPLTRQALDEATAALAGQCHAITIAVGGGSVLDFAKLLHGSGTGADQGCLIAIPTTAGTGSEATQFAVLYDQGRKLSVDDPGLLPTHAIVDSALTDQMPTGPAACAAVDALAQAIESRWSIRADHVSTALAERAISMIWRSLEDGVLRDLPGARDALSEGAHLAGKAINITRTTAAHAFSYGFTIRYGIPHGHAVMLTLPRLLSYNARISMDDCQDPRGPAHSLAAVQRIAELLGTSDPDAAARSLVQLMGRLQLPTLEMMPWIHIEQVADTTDPTRLANNPRRIDPAALGALVHG